MHTHVHTQPEFSTHNSRIVTSCFYLVAALFSSHIPTYHISNDFVCVCVLESEKERRRVCACVEYECHESLQGDGVKPRVKNPNLQQGSGCTFKPNDLKHTSGDTGSSSHQTFPDSKSTTGCSSFSVSETTTTGVFVSDSSTGARFNPQQCRVSVKTHA